MRGQQEKEQVMANPNEIEPNIHSADSVPSGPRLPDDKVYRLTRRLRGASAPGTGELAEPESKLGPDDRKSEVRPSAEPLHPLAAASPVRSKKSSRRPL